MLLADTRGSVLVEYVVLLCLVALPACFAFVSLGRQLAALFYLQQLVLTFPLP